MKYNYIVITQKITDELGEDRLAYGIEVHNEFGTSIKTVSDVFSDIHRAEELAERCNRLELDPIHLMDVIEDAMAY